MELRINHVRIKRVLIKRAQPVLAFVLAPLKFLDLDNSVKMNRA